MPLEEAAESGCAKCQKELDTGRASRREHDDGCPWKAAEEETYESDGEESQDDDEEDEMKVRSTSVTVIWPETVQLDTTISKYSTREAVIC